MKTIKTYSPKIKKIGIEFEGEFILDPNTKSITDALNPYWNVARDGSLLIQHLGYCREITSVAFKPDELDEIVDKLKVLIPSDDDESSNNEDVLNKKVAYPNTTAGTHIHLSFSSKQDYDLINTFQFYNDFVKAYLKKFTLPKYSARLHNNKYCAPFQKLREFINITAKQRKATEKLDCRYRAINYCETYKKTVEIRLFPYVTTLNGIKEIVNFVVDFVQNYKFNISKYEEYQQAKKYDYILLRKDNSKYLLWEDVIDEYVNDFQIVSNGFMISMSDVTYDFYLLLTKTASIKLIKEN